MWNGSGGLHVHISSLLRKQSQKLFCENLLFYEEWTIAGEEYLPLNFGFWKIVSWNKSSFFWNFRFRQKISFSWCCLGNSKKSIHIFFVFSRYITFSLAWISLNFRLAKTWICEETCFLVRVFPVLNLMYRAMSSFRPRIQIISSLLFLKSLELDIVNISFKSFELYGHKMSPGRSNNIFFSWVSGPKYEQQVCM